MASDLEALVSSCIRCGFCLESCPTFKLTGEESQGPRGRIYLVRRSIEGDLSWKNVAASMDTCLGCRACETACPSGVKYGEIFELARERLVKDGAVTSTHALLGLATNSNLLKVDRFLPRHKLPKTLGGSETQEAYVPRRQPRAKWGKLEAPAATKGQVALLSGCVMSELFPRVHEATKRLIQRVGFEPVETKPGLCCGSLHLHNGYVQEAASKSSALLKSLPGGIPIIVNSAGCGSTLKELGANCMDISEFLLANGLVDLLANSTGIDGIATYHDACHLAHAQKITQQPRELLSAIPELKLVPLPNSDQCCGSAGIYNLRHPKIARQLLDQKWQAVESTKASIVVLGNPGCHAWLHQAAEEHANKVQVLHIAEILEASFSGLP